MKRVIFGNSGTHNGSIRGIALIKTDVPGEGELEIRFSGFVK